MYTALRRQGNHVVSSQNLSKRLCASCTRRSAPENDGVSSRKTFHRLGCVRISSSPVHASQVGPPNLDGPTERIVEPLDERDDGALASARRPDEGDGRAFGDVERNIVENWHVWAGGVGKADRRKLDIGLECRFLIIAVIRSMSVPRSRTRPCSIYGGGQRASMKTDLPLFMEAASVHP
jgi:hypothetical protein